MERARNLRFCNFLVGDTDLGTWVLEPSQLGQEQIELVLVGGGMLETSFPLWLLPRTDSKQGITGLTRMPGSLTPATYFQPGPPRTPRASRTTPPGRMGKSLFVLP